MSWITPREHQLRQKVLQITAAKPDRDQQEHQAVQEGIYQETGVLASSHLKEEELSYLYACLPRPTRTMLRLAGRDSPQLMTMYDLRHSLISCGGADAAVKIKEARKISKVVLAKVAERVKSAKAAGHGEVEPVRLLELGSGISDVSAMVWRLVRDGLVRAGYKQDPLSFFTILDIEYSTPTGRTAARLLAESGRHNVAVRYGPEVGDATRLVGLEDSSFDVVWSSLMLGAFEVVRDADGVMADSPGARAVMDQAWRVARDGGVVVHTGFSYLNGPPDEYHAKTPGGKVAPWRSEPVARRWGLLRPSVLLQQRLSKLWRDMNVRYTQEAFDYWDWFDGGDFAAWEMQRGLGSRYKTLKVRRYGGWCPEPVRAMAGGIILTAPGAAKEDTALYQNAVASITSLGVAFTMAMSTVSKAESAAPQP